MADIGVMPVYPSVGRLGRPRQLEPNFRHQVRHHFNNSSYRKTTQQETFVSTPIDPETDLVKQRWVSSEDLTWNRTVSNVRD